MTRTEYLALQKKEEQFKNKYLKLWLECKNSVERRALKQKYYANKGKFTEMALDRIWIEITSF